MLIRWRRSRLPGLLEAKARGCWSACLFLAFPASSLFLLLLFSLSLSMSAWCWSLMTKTMAEMCWLAKANFSPSLFLSLLYAPFCFFTAVRSFSPVFFWFFYGFCSSSLLWFSVPKIPCLRLCPGFLPRPLLCFFLFQSPVLFVFHSFSVSSVLPPVRSPCLVTCLSVFVSGSRPLFFVSFSPCFLLWFLAFPPFCSALLCSAFYRAREPQNQSCLCRTVIQITNGIVGRRRGPRFAADFLLNRLPPCETKGMMNSASKRRRLCPWEWLFFTLAPKRFKLNNWDLKQ